MADNRITWNDVQRHLAERAAARPPVDKVPCRGLDCDVMFEPWTNEWHCSDECYQKRRSVEGEGVQR